MSYNFNDVSDTNDFTLPEGVYPAQIVTASWESSKANPSNKFIKLVIACEGIELYEYLNLVNINEKACSIGMRKTKQILTSLGKSLEYGSEQALADALKGRLMVEVETKTDSYGSKSVVKKYSPLNGEVKKSAPDFSVNDIPFTEVEGLWR